MRTSFLKLQVFLFILFLLIDPDVAVGQWRNKLNNALQKATEKVAEEGKKIAKEEIEEADKRADSTQLMYAISMSDNSATFETKSLLQKNNQMLSGILLGPDKAEDPDKEAQQWIDLGENFYSGQKYKSAEVAFLAAILIYETEGDINNLNYYTALSDLGLLYHQMGRFDKAEEFTSYAMNGRKELFGQISIPYAVSLNNLAVLKKDIGSYRESENLLDKALKVNDQAKKENLVGKAIMLNNKGSLYQTLGRYEEAEKLLRESLDLAETEFKEKSGRYQKLMINLAVLLQQMKKYEESEEILQRAIRLKERRLGKKHPDYAHMLMYLAAIYLEMDKPEEVEELLIEAKDIYEKKLGNESLPYATATSYLGKFYLHQREFEKATSLLEKTVDIRADKLGTNNPIYVNSKEDLAILYWKSGKVEEAFSLYKEVLDKTIEFIQTYFAPMSEAEKTRYWDKIVPKFQGFNAFTAEYGPTNPEIYQTAYNYRLATKGLLLSATSKIKQEILQSGDRQLINDYEDWLDQKEMIARIYEYSTEELKDQKINLDSLIEAANRTERSLSERSQIFSEGYGISGISYPDIIAVLDDNEAIVEIIQFNDFTNRFTDEVRYLMLVGKKGSVNPKAVFLENGTQLDGRYYSYYKNAVRLKMEDKESYNQYWKDLDLQLVGINYVYVSLDGIYNQINANTFLKPSGKFLIEELDITIVGNTKEVINIKSEDIRDIESVVLIGAPDYGDDELLAPLPGTKIEIESIDKILKDSHITPEIHIEANATEQSIKNTSNPTVLHIATHGFFQKDVNPAEKQKVFGVEPENAMDNPLLRSGLFLTGAADALKEQNNGDLAGDDNGILMAFEAMNLSLDQTDVVVLSACETGLGDIKSGEGVYGLQRAFLVAGSKAVVMSLWKVNDQTTQFLMSGFYKEWVKTGDMISSFKKAQLKLKSDFNDPYYWGAFVLIR